MTEAAFTADYKLQSDWLCVPWTFCTETTVYAVRFLTQLSVKNSRCVNSDFHTKLCTASIVTPYEKLHNKIVTFWSNNTDLIQTTKKWNEPGTNKISSIQTKLVDRKKVQCYKHNRDSLFQAAFPQTDVENRVIHNFFHFPLSEYTLWHATDVSEQQEEDKREAPMQKMRAACPRMIKSFSSSPGNRSITSSTTRTVEFVFLPCPQNTQLEDPGSLNSTLSCLCLFTQPMMLVRTRG